MPQHDWNATYASNQFIPWDTGKPDPNLVEMVEQGLVPRGRALDVGCGTGTDSIWLDKQGYEVVALDVAPLAIERARAKAKAASASRCQFEVRDFLVGEPMPGSRGSFQLVFDRGCFHAFDEQEQQTAFASRVASLLGPGGVWLSLIGSTEGPAREKGPPRRSALEIVSAVEPYLELVTLRAIQFAPIPGETAPPGAWLCLWHRRATPAQPSTR
jgi:SAM-dependent methyltransferase